eukprot:TRINITY_DN250_c1_g3_i1.p1 TRINITY_DN250_c1_g3~~TRINITY_DN250_c1_g3_i1.p1  ORF type:complete len:386 (+),score=109.00 TRINITY_DN250_c1_g3_i1:226-1383(+)
MCGSGSTDTLTAPGSRYAGCDRQWQSDDSVVCCGQCASMFGIAVRRHHCRRCGGVFCGSCTSQRRSLPLCYGYGLDEVRVCAPCAERVPTQMRSPVHCSTCRRRQRAAMPQRRRRTRSLKASIRENGVSVALDGRAVRPGVCTHCGGARQVSWSDGDDGKANVCFFDALHGVELRFTLASGDDAGLRYTVDGADRPGPITKIQFSARNMTLLFPETGKGATLPHDDDEASRVLGELRALATVAGVEHSLPADADQAHAAAVEALSPGDVAARQERRRKARTCGPPRLAANCKCAATATWTRNAIDSLRAAAQSPECREDERMSARSCGSRVDSFDESVGHCCDSGNSADLSDTDLLKLVQRYSAGEGRRQRSDEVSSGGSLEAGL